jgi:hypothetical protein
MQTFLPYASFAHSAAVLDYKRLGKQRVETWQILNALQGKSKGWVNHPATRMWRGYEEALACYGDAICFEWIRRGYQDTLLPRFHSLITHNAPVLPSWFGDEALHLSHRSNLVRKDPNYYRKYWSDVPDNMPYVWPVPLEVSA